MLSANRRRRKQIGLLDLFQTQVTWGCEEEDSDPGWRETDPSVLLPRNSGRYRTIVTLSERRKKTLTSHVFTLYIGQTIKEEPVREHSAARLS